VGVGLTDSICVTVDLGAGVDVVSGAGVTLGGWVVEVLDVVECVVDVDVEFWLVLIVFDVVVEELEPDVDVPVSDAEVLSEVVDCEVEEVVGEVTALAGEGKTGTAAAAPATGRRGRARFLIRRLRFAWSRC
jgi:hypothetical protein